MRGIGGMDPGWGVTIVRVATALVFILHGFYKYQGGLDKVSAFFAKVMIPLPGITGPFIATLELFGGILLLVGLLGRWIALLLACDMLVADFYVQLPARGWMGSEFERMLFAAALLLFIAGPGRLALDNLWLEKRK